MSVRLATALVLGLVLPPLSATADGSDGVALIDSCGTYVRMREGAETYQPSQLERTKLCQDRTWEEAERLKKQRLAPGEKLRPRQERLHCALDPTPVGPNQAVRVVYKYLADHPELLHRDAATLARDALREAFSCEVAVYE